MLSETSAAQVAADDRSLSQIPGGLISLPPHTSAQPPECQRKASTPKRWGNRSRQAPQEQQENGGLADCDTVETGVWLRCPIRAGEPERYANVLKHCPDTWYRGLSNVNEHLWRYHSWDTRCENCGKTFRGSTHKSIAKDKASHDCRPQEKGKGGEETSLTYMSKELQMKWRTWKETLKKGRCKNKEKECSVIVNHWKVLFELFNPGKKVPDPVALPPSAWVPSRRGRKPSANTAASQPSPSNQSLGKRQARSSPSERRPEREVDFHFLEQQPPAQNARDDVGFETAPEDPTKPHYFTQYDATTQTSGLEDGHLDPLASSIPFSPFGQPTGQAVPTGLLPTTITSATEPGSMVFSDTSVYAPFSRPVTPSSHVGPTPAETARRLGNATLRDNFEPWDYSPEVDEDVFALMSCFFCRQSPCMCYPPEVD
ncbi:uncharacterized protein THITE_2124745 [Thermothielavioides terrestris NRRL 8126]|uniref:Uncharacterized protein n=1 Tax=Thermothielavioides terrestris (strain ATCC 38088 / NRRL 8126) TaxID=578455 RepID=G2RGH8_THETT|nr:uncharacterized protein THITE_2124745 [Thermothielavioides terrestris NRRL 8126]AEO71867.1 hypothetical protein THITE_2124745 [Thermothielavioides terrestris NRRL 8126]